MLEKRLHHRFRQLVSAAVLGLTLAACLTTVGMHSIVAQQSEQIADPRFDLTVSHPAYTRSGPKVLFDEAHQNIHTTDGRYKPFVELIKHDGYRVVANRRPFQPRTLANYNVLVIANALGKSPDAPAFTEQERQAVKAWVQQGGSLLLIADHRPFGAAATGLAEQFGVNMGNSYTVDTVNYDRETGIPSFLLFSRQNQLLTDHPITRGRNPSERINRAITFTGQSLSVLSGSVALLSLSDTAKDLKQRVARASEVAAAMGVSAAERAQGVALSVGNGRVVILGEAAMLSAQLLKQIGQPDILMGMNRAGFDNRQLALNIMHWLSKLLN
jgi:hypothetical protein